jgi:thiol-disulfide isomerase/thioredoxin
MNLVNQFSYPLIVLGILAVVFMLTRRRLRQPLVWGLQLSLIALFVIGFFLLRTGDGDLNDIETYDAMLANDKPIFVEFFSNFCTFCLVLRPTVDDIIANMGDDYNVLRVNIHSSGGIILREKLAFSFTPEFLLLDANGAEVWRDHTPPSQDMLTLALNPR